MRRHRNFASHPARATFESLESRRLLAAQLVSDMDPGTLDGGLNAPTPVVTMGKNAYFLANDGVHGEELWRTDGTSAGTQMVIDLNPGPADSAPGDLVVSNGWLYFVAQSPNGPALWRTDGSAANTTRLLSDASGMVQPVDVAGTLYWINDQWTTSTLWKSDGTPAGTVSVATLPSFSSYFHLTAVGTRLFFNANNEALWTSDGTSAGTIPLTGNVEAGEIVPYNGQAFLGTMGLGLYVSDGTVAGTRHLATQVQNAQNLAVINNKVYFSGTFSYPGDFQPAVTDGTAAGTAPIAVKNLPAGIKAPAPADETSFAGQVYFTSDVNGQGLWRTDAQLGAVQVAKFTNSVSSLLVLGTTLYFAADDGISGPELWKTDGTAAGTQLVADLIPGSVGSGATPMATLGGKVLFWGRDLLNGYELHLTDGTPAGTTLLKDINTLPNGTTFNAGNYSGSLENSLYFAADNVVSGVGSELGKTNGTAAGTSLVKDLTPGPGGTSIESFLSYNGRLYFLVYNDGLWQTDGTAAGTFQALPANVYSPTVFNGKIIYYNGLSICASDGTLAGTTEISPILSPYFDQVKFCALGGTLYFTVDDSQAGAQLWQTDGTAAGTKLVRNFLPEGATSISSILAYKNRLMFVLGYSGVQPTCALWTSDGTSSGSSVLLHPTGPVAPSSAVLSLAAGYVFMEDPNYGSIWRSDGTSGGSIELKSVIGQFAVSPIFSVGDRAVFSAYAGLWTSDGTVAGTSVLEGFGSSTIKGLTVVDGVAFFSSGDIAHGTELWQSDGTVAGTSLVSDINSGAASSNPQLFGSAGSWLYFAAKDPTHGNELWRASAVNASTLKVSSNGPYQTPEGTSIQLSSSLLPGAPSGAISYAWDLNYDGNPDDFQADATGVAPVVQFADGPNQHTVAVEAIGPAGQVAIDVTSVQVNNVPPVGTLSGATVLAGSSATVQFQALSDVSPVDRAAGFLYSFDFNNDGVFEIVDSTNPAAAVPASYLSAPGPRSIVGRVKDKDGGFTDYTTIVTVDLPVAISGTVYGDSNANGARDAGEVGVAGFGVYLDANNNGTLDSADLVATADGSGDYSFSPLFPGTYAVRPVLSSGWNQTDDGSQMSFAFDGGTILSGMDMGVQGPPEPSLGGPYSVAEGASITLNAGASSEVGGSIASYEWDTNYNGSTFVARATGVSIPFSAVGLDGPSNRAIALRITDGHGTAAVASGSISIANASPTAAFASGGAVTAGSNGSVSFTNQADPAPADVAAGFRYSYDFNNDGTFDSIDSAASSATVPASYLATAGLHMIKGRIKDKDGGFTDYTTTIQVNASSTGTITGTVFNDANGNGLKDSGETSGVSGQKFFLDLNRNSILDSGEPAFTTAANGVFSFSGLAAGTYRVRMTQLTGWKWTAPTSGYYEVTVAAGQTVTSKNYLEQKTAALLAAPAAARPSSSISGVVFNDKNANGKQDAGESGLAGWVVYVDANNNGRLDSGELSFTTGSDGSYHFTLAAGRYVVRQVLKKGFARTTSLGAYPIALRIGQTIAGENFGDR